jgi:hypothetical protein
MQITIEAINADAVQCLGCMQVPSFRTKFSSSAIEGWARFVPANGDPEACVGKSFYVEINHERVTDLKRIDDHVFTERIVALDESEAFQVFGTVTSVMPLGEPTDNVILSVASGEAVFTLARCDLGETELSLGEKIAFVAHELSLWDEAI